MANACSRACRYCSSWSSRAAGHLPIGAKVLRARVVSVAGAESAPRLPFGQARCIWVDVVGGATLALARLMLCVEELYLDAQGWASVLPTVALPATLRSLKMHRTDRLFAHDELCCALGPRAVAHIAASGPRRLFQRPRHLSSPATAQLTGPARRARHIPCPRRFPASAGGSWPRVSEAADAHC